MAATETRGARALDDLYRKHVGEVYRYAYAVLGNHADAEDVTQTAFVNAFRALERGERPRQPGNWLLAIAHNVIRQRWRQEQARPTTTELVEDVAGPPVEDDPHALADVVRALQRIPQSQREALVMRELEGRSYREMAEILGLSASALEALLFRARRSLTEELEHLVTCDRAELAVSRRLDGRLSRKERRRLDAHLAECPACARFSASQKRHRTAIRGLAVLPLPLSLAFWKGAPTAAAAASLPSIGAAAGASSVGLATAGNGAGIGASLFGGGLAVKAAAVVAAVGVTTGVSLERLELTDGPGRGRSGHAVTESGPASRISNPTAARQRGVTAKAAGNERRADRQGRAAAAKAERAAQRARSGPDKQQRMDKQRPGQPVRVKEPPSSHLRPSSTGGSRSKATTSSGQADSPAAGGKGGQRPKGQATGKKPQRAPAPEANKTAKSLQNGS